jgi:hypothetical protein
VSNDLTNRAADEERQSLEWWRDQRAHDELADAIEAAIREQERVEQEMRSEAVRVLNEAIALDPEAVRLLCNARVPCNEALADHPSIQVGRGPSVGQSDHDWVVGMLGIVNGICGVDDNGWGFVGVEFDECGKPIKARLLGPEDRKHTARKEETGQ